MGTSSVELVGEGGGGLFPLWHADSGWRPQQPEQVWENVHEMKVHLLLSRH